MDFDGFDARDFTFHIHRSAVGLAVDSRPTVRVVHNPTGITAVCDEWRSQYRNKQQALEAVITALKLRNE